MPRRRRLCIVAVRRLAGGPLASPAHTAAPKSSASACASSSFQSIDPKCKFSLLTNSRCGNVFHEESLLANARECTHVYACTCDLSHLSSTLHMQCAAEERDHAYDTITDLAKPARWFCNAWQRRWRDHAYVPLPSAGTHMLTCTCVREDVAAAPISQDKIARLHARACLAGAVAACQVALSTDRWEYSSDRHPHCICICISSMCTAH